MEWLSDPQAWIALFTLTALEIVLGVDNIIFITILVGRLPEAQRRRARVLGLGFAMFTRIALLLSLAWMMTLTEAAVFRPGTGQGDRRSRSDTHRRRAFSPVEERPRIHNSLEGGGRAGDRRRARELRRCHHPDAIIDIVFSLDSVITAVGMVDQVPIMVLAIVIAVVVMMFAAADR